MATIIDMNEIREECKRKSSFRFRIEQSARKVGDWCKENIQTITVAAPVALTVIGSITKVARSMIRRSHLAKEQKWKDTHFYDRSLGHYVEVKRKPKNNELSRISARRRNGEKLTDILTDMRLIK